MMKNIVKKLFISALIASVASMAAASATVVINVGDRSSHGILNLDKLIIKASTASNAPNAVVLSSGSKVGTTQICNTGLTLCKNVTDLWTGTDTHYTGKIVAGSSNATSNSTSNVSDPYINYVENGSFRSGIQLKAGEHTTIKANGGIITISSSGGTNGNHYTGYNRVTNATNGVTNNSSTNNNTYLNHVENNTVTSSNQIKGAGSVTVSANNGTIFISGTDNDTTYSQATSNTLGLVKLGSDTQQNTTANSVSSTASRTYAIQKNSNGQLVVNVPRTDNNTHYTGKIVAGSKTATTNSTSDVFDPYINYVENGSVRSGIQLKAGNATTSIKANSGVITISVFDLEALGLGSYWKLNGSTLSTSGGSYNVVISGTTTLNNITYLNKGLVQSTGGATLRGNLNFAWQDDGRAFSNTITTAKSSIAITTPVIRMDSTQVNITGATTIANGILTVKTGSNSKIYVNKVCDAAGHNCKDVSELGGNSYWKLSSSALQITSGYGLNVSANNDKSFNFSINDPDLSTPLKTNLKIDGNGVNITKGGLNVTGVTKMNNNLTVTAGGLNVTGATTLNNNLTVKGTTTANNTVNITANGLNVTGATTLNNNLTVKGTTTANNTVNITYGGLNVTGNTTLKNNLTVGNNITAGGTTTLNGNLNVNQWAQFYNSLSVTNGNLTVAGNATVNSGLTVSKNATFSSGLTVSKNATFNGNTYMYSGSYVNKLYVGKNTGYYDTNCYTENCIANSTNDISAIRFIPKTLKDGQNIETMYPCTYQNEGFLVYWRDRNPEGSNYDNEGRLSICGCGKRMGQTNANAKCSWYTIHEWSY